MCEEELLHALAIQCTPGIGDINAKKLISRFGSAKEVHRQTKSSLEKASGIGVRIAASIKESTNLKRAEKELGYLKKKKLKVWYYFSPDYPKKLFHCPDGPLLLFGKGDIDLHAQRMISVIGTRNMTPNGREVCCDLISGLKPYAPTIVSGFAYGVDITAHRAAMEQGLQTLAVMAHGLEEVYPSSHRKFIPELLGKGGLLTEFWHSDTLIQQNFIRRNRIVAGLSEATLVIESGEKGGAMVTAAIANSYHRDVFAVPGRAKDRYSVGCNRLIARNQAALVAEPDDLIKAMMWDLPKSRGKVIQKRMFGDLNEEERQIAEYLEKHGKSMIDTIALNTGMRIQSAASLLFSLEVKGLVRPTAGKCYEWI
jgi:DNA processing protein